VKFENEEKNCNVRNKSKTSPEENNDEKSLLRRREKGKKGNVYLQSFVIQQEKRICPSQRSQVHSIGFVLRELTHGTLIVIVLLHPGRRFPLLLHSQCFLRRIPARPRETFQLMRLQVESPYRATTSSILPT
jgi:hypothetical protein